MGLIKAEEPPTALLLGHAAFLSSRRNARRRAALWYLYAADRLEKAGIVRVLAVRDLMYADDTAETNSSLFLPAVSPVVQDTAH